MIAIVMPINLEQILLTHGINNIHYLDITLECSRCGHRSTRPVKVDNYSTYESTLFCRRFHWMGAPYDHIDCLHGCSSVNPISLVWRLLQWFRFRRSIVGYATVIERETRLRLSEPGRRRHRPEGRSLG